MDNIPLFGKRKAGLEPIEYPHPKLEEILAETYGIFVYQEQVMQAAQILAGYSLGDADLLRRAMGKKNQAEMDKQREIFVEGCARKSPGIDADKANELFDLIDKFAGYGFNKSHAAAYALLAYQTAWLKAHYPEEFFAASMCFDMHQSEKLAVFVDDARRATADYAVAAARHQPIVPRPSFTVEQTDEGYAVRYALAGIRNVGEKGDGPRWWPSASRCGPVRPASQNLFERMPQGLDEFAPARSADLRRRAGRARTQSREGLLRECRSCCSPLPMQPITRTRRAGRAAYVRRPRMQAAEDTFACG